MTKKFFIPVILMSLFSVLTGCAPATQASPASATATIVYATPDQSLATPEVGFATVVTLQGARGVLMRSLPDPKSGVAGLVQPGDAGRILGIDATGTWLLIEIKTQRGWIPIQLLNYNIAQ